MKKRLQGHLFHILLAIIVFVLLVGYLMPISFDASTCSTGYKKWLVDNHQADFKKLLDNKFEHYTLENTDMIDDITWDYHTVYIPLSIAVNNKYIHVLIMGHRYWMDKYYWGVGSAR